MAIKSFLHSLLFIQQYVEVFNVPALASPPPERARARGWRPLVAAAAPGSGSRGRASPPPPHAAPSHITYTRARRQGGNLRPAE